MRRSIESVIKSWATKDASRPLLIRGARRVGKTYAAEEIGRRIAGDAFVKLDFQTDLELIAPLFDCPTDDVDTIVARISDYKRTPIRKETAFILFDEVQLCERALNSLRFFSGSGWRICATGSQLGVTTRKRKLPFPSGVRQETMHPMSFEEFLWAMGHDQLVDEIRSSFEIMGPLAPSLHEKALRLYRQYLVVGGMPEAVQTYIDDQSIIDVAEKHRIILDGYSADTNKYADERLSTKTRACFDSIPQQLAKENRKFQYKVVRAGGNASLFGDALDWLVLSGTVARCSLVGQIESPLEAFVNPSAFKIYQADTGLLVSKAGAQRADILAGIGGTFMGALTENYVAQQLSAMGYPLHYWARDNRAEIDFVVEKQGCLSAIEVKAGENTRSRSLSSLKKTHPGVRLIRLSTKPFGMNDGLMSVPLYAAFCL